ncbi:hypothetical protein K438DRAFT_1786639 [Mycena galopus ATCC 62051]|nr:hypothetical protein K438DRAFT_1786639 [Mycena galopus ATCC 62051]
MSFEESYAELANRLILRAKLSKELGRLLPYDGLLVRLVLQEQHELEKRIRALQQDGVTTQSGPPKQTLSSGIPFAAPRRYSDRLLGRGRSLAHVLAQSRADMSQDEITYLRSHHDSVVQYREELSATDVMGLTMGIEHPPMESPFVTVECVLPIGGPVHTESGLLNFEIGPRYVLQKSDVEHLLLQGYLREV